MRLLILIAALTICACHGPLAKEDRPQGSEPQTAKEFDQVPPADLSAIPESRTVKDWKNPFLVIRPEGVELVTAGGSSGINSASVDRMREILTSLPRNAWPFGRIVAVSYLSIRSRDGTALINANRQALEKMLGEIDVKIKRWP